MVKPKKYLGQHFLTDKNISRKIVSSLKAETYKRVLEIGPGKGILSEILLDRDDVDLKVIEIDEESIDYLNDTFPNLKGDIIFGDFLKYDISEIKEPSFGVIGNLPYNISSQIFFRILEFRNRIPEAVVMIQKEVAERISSPSGNKKYGILSVFLQSYYNIEYLFTVNEKVFYPPPKVKSAVIRLTRNDTKSLDCNEILFFKVVKMSFNHRRKTLRNSLKSILVNLQTENEIFNKRPEQLNVNDFVRLTSMIDQSNV